MNKLKLDFHGTSLTFGRCRLGDVRLGRPADRAKGSTCRDAESCFLVILCGGEVGKILDIFEVGIVVWNLGLPRFPNSFFI